MTILSSGAETLWRSYISWQTAPMKLLLIEDNQKASAWVRKGLEEAGYIVDYAADGRDGLHLGLSHPYSLVILDIMLPGMDGWQVLKTLRTASQIPVICLTARDSVDDRV
jgi:two-component system OmpR family response regulator